MQSALGELVLLGDGQCLTGICFRTSLGRLPERSIGVADPTPFRSASAQLQEYFAGERRAFDVPLAAVGTAFQQAVWRELSHIPYGETISYGELARRIGIPRACRAVGSANGANPLPIIVPCHRVIGADGSLTGFGAGLPIKRQLLALERAHMGLWDRPASSQQPETCR